MDFPPFDKALKDGFAILSEDSYGASAFFFNAACFQIMNIMQAMAVVNIFSKYFFSKILDKKKVF